MRLLPPQALLPQPAAQHRFPDCGQQAGLVTHGAEITRQGLASETVGVDGAAAVAAVGAGGVRLGLLETLK